MKLFVIRHGATEAGAKGIILSRIDGRLNALGRQQAEELVVKLSGENIDSIYSSPLKRAVDSASPLAKKLNKEIQKDDRLLEVDMGSFSGEPLDSTIEAFGLSCVPLMDSYRFDLTPYGGESDQQVRKRVQSFLDDLRKNEDKTVAIFTHDGTLHWFYLLCANKKVTGQPNASIHTFEI